MGISNIPYFQDVQVRPHEAVHQPLQGKEVENLRIVTERLVTSISLSIYTTDVSYYAKKYERVDLSASLFIALIASCQSSGTARKSFWIVTSIESERGEKQDFDAFF